MRRNSVALLTALVLAAAAASHPAAAGASVAPPGFFGVTPLGESGDADFEAMGEGNVGTYRWQLNWPAVERQDDQFDWSVPDDVVEDLARNGIEPLPVLYGSTCFVVECRDTEYSPPEAQRQPPIGSEEAKAQWAEFVQAAVGRYGPGGAFWEENPQLPEQPIRTWQIWNEQNSSKFYLPSPSVQDYAELLRISSEAIRGVDAKSQVLLGGMFATPRSEGAIDAWDYLAGLYAAGGADYFDAVAIHPFAPQLAGVEPQIERIRNVIEENDDADTPIWVTEIGWGSEDGPHPLEAGLEGQAELLGDAFELLLSQRREWRLEGVVWYAWRDPAQPTPACPWCDSAGLLDAEGDPKPSFERYTQFARGTVASAGEADGSGGAPTDVIVALVAGALLIAAGWYAGRRLRRS
jgi:polysaccharide biosynthesis protein PslG